MKLRSFPSTPPADTTQQVDPQIRARILIETAMEQAQFANADATLIIRQLAGELSKTEATLCDVRLVVQELYEGDRPGAEAYLSYLAKHGFPKAPVTDGQQQAAYTRTAQNQAILLHPQHPQSAYGERSKTQPDAAYNNIAFYGGNLIAELVANSAYSAILFGERRSGASAILRALLYDKIAKSSSAILDILDFHNGAWQGLENIQTGEGARIVNYLTLHEKADIEAVANKLSAVAAEVRRRQQQQRTQSLSLSTNTLTPYLFLIDGLSEIHGALPGWSADRRSKMPVFSRAASSLRVVLSHGPAVGLSCVATARNHSTCLCDATALGETRLLFLGRVSSGRNGGYRAVDRAIEDRELLPSPHDRSRYRETLSAVKRLAQPIVFTPNGIPRLGALGDFGSYLHTDLLMHYQQFLEAQA
ncbi:MAG: hypothetical protein AAFV46_01825 [Cyanobacteria bacterium J06635_11]